MCITNRINRILSNYFEPVYYTNFLMCDVNLYMIKIDSMDILKSSFSKLTNSLHPNNKVCNSDKKNQTLYLEEQKLNINQQMIRQTLYHDLTYDHGICLLN